MKARHSLLVLALVACAFGAAAADSTRVEFPSAGKSFPEGDAGEMTYSIDVKLAFAINTTVTVTVNSVSSQAVEGVDYVRLSEVLTYKPGETAKVVKFTIKGDLITEGHEVVSLNARQPGENVGEFLRIEIRDDDPRPDMRFQSVKVAEGTSQSPFAVFRVTPDRQPGKLEARIDYKTIDGTAKAGEDYQATSGTLVIPPFATYAEVRVPLIGDDVVEPDETFTLNISKFVNTEAYPSSVTATILNDDVPAPPFRISAPSIYEGDSGTKQLEVSVFMATASSSPVTVTVQTTGGGSATGDVDYQRFAEQITFAPGVTEMNVEATVFGDTLVEGEETFWIGVLQDGVVRASEKVRIRDDDDPRPVVSIADVEVRETDDHAGKAQFQVTLSKPSLELVRVSYETVPDTASLLDFTHAAGELLFQPGETSRTITVNIIGDRTREETETFHVELSNPQGLLLGDGSGAGTILDNEVGKRRAARH
jgi:Calx-beta domain